MSEPFAGTAAASLAERLTAIRERYPKSEPEWVAEVVTAVLVSLGGEPSPQQIRLLQEVEELGRTIANAKAEISALGVDDITASHIPFATDELDAIVTHTASATDLILESCETLDTVATEIPSDAAAKLQEATTRIYEACSFQDITGQRIAKVVSALKDIDAKVSHILETFGSGRTLNSGNKFKANPGLLNGPQLPDEAMLQSDIDQLLASFD